MKRCIKIRGIDKTVYISFHSFSNSYELGYGESTYLSLVDEYRHIHCVYIKARVTPRRFVSIPPLELAASVLAVKISALIKKELEIEELAEYFWTDSKVDLGYIAYDYASLHIICIKQGASNSRVEDHL